MTTPVCPGCGAKFQHDIGTLRCKACGLPDEVAYRGMTAVRRWQKRAGRQVSRGGSFYRRRKAHGRSGGASKRVRS